jgi:DNA replication initiation complex subunit (GINS family)
MSSDNRIDFIKIEEIFNILKREIQLTSGPQSIPLDFYLNISNLISKLKNNTAEKELEDENTKIKTEKISNQIKNNLIDLFIESVTLLFI